MTLIIKIFIPLFFCFVVYKALVNTNYWYRLKKYKKLHQEYIKATSGKNKDKEVKLGWKLIEAQSDIVNLFKKAGLSSFTLTINQFAGYGYVQPKKIDIFQNLACLHTVDETSVPRAVLNYFARGIGVYKTRIQESFSIFYWIDVLIYLPQKIFVYLGFSLEGKKTKLISKTLDLAYWFAIVIINIVLPLMHYHVLLVHS